MQAPIWCQKGQRSPAALMFEMVPQPRMSCMAES